MALLWLVFGAGQAQAEQLRGVEFQGLRAGASIDQVDARFPLNVRTIYTEPEFPSLGVYLYRGEHRDGAVTLRADFDRERRLYRWSYARTALRARELETALDALLDRHGPPDSAVTSGGHTAYIYAAPWSNGNPGPEVRLRFGIEEAQVETPDGLVAGARLVIDFVDYGADEANIAAAYDAAVTAERRRVGGDAAQASP